MALSRGGEEKEREIAVVVVVVVSVFVVVVVVVVVIVGVAGWVSTQEYRNTRSGYSLIYVPKYIY